MFPTWRASNVDSSNGTFYSPVSTKLYAHAVTQAAVSLRPGSALAMTSTRRSSFEQIRLREKQSVSRKVHRRNGRRRPLYSAANHVRPGRHFQCFYRHFDEVKFDASRADRGRIPHARSADSLAVTSQPSDADSSPCSVADTDGPQRVFCEGRNSTWPDGPFRSASVAPPRDRSHCHRCLAGGFLRWVAQRGDANLPSQPERSGPRSRRHCDGHRPRSRGHARAVGATGV